MLSQIAFDLQANVFAEFVKGYFWVILLILLGFVLHFVPLSWNLYLERQYTRSPLVLKSLTLAVLIWVLIQTASSDVVPFIYFQF